MPKLFTSSTQNPTTKVLRIQHVKHGYGPYTSDNPEVQNIIQDSNLKTPQASRSFSPEDITHLNDPSIAKKFAFQDEQQMHQAIGKDKVEALKAHGYEPTWVDASHVWGDGKQVFYTPVGAEEKRSKQLEDFKTRSKFKQLSPEEIAQENAARAVKKTMTKSMKNGGLGGVGSVKAGAVLPSKISLPKPGHNSLSSKIKMPSVAPQSKKDPMKSIQQTQNKDIKDLKMKEAQAKMTEIVKTLPNGQWVLEKSRCWEGYEPTPGKKPYEEGSCRPKNLKKKECECEKEIDKCGCDNSK